MSFAGGDDPSLPSSAKVVELTVAALPYLGPFGRFYMAPVALTGWRHYSESRLSVTTETVKLAPRFLHEVGARLGFFLLNNNNNLDLSVQGTSSFDTQTLYRFTAEVAYEIF